MGVVSQKLRNSARGQQCTLQIPGICSRDPAETILAHLPSETKGMGNKSHDFFAVLSCAKCHYHLDNHRLSERDSLYFSLRALMRTWEYWVTSGLVVVPEKQAPPRPLSKTVQRPSLFRSSTP